MRKAGEIINWVLRVFFLITFPVLLVFHLIWFRLEPYRHVIDYLFSFTLLIIYGIFVRAFWVTKKNFVVKTLLLLICMALLFMIFLDIDFHLPRIETTAQCNGITYNITSTTPLFDEYLVHTKLIEWGGIFNFDTHVLGYGGIGSGPHKIVCDEEKQEANIVKIYPEPGILVYTDGSNPRRYEEYVGAQLGSNRYFLSRAFFIPDDCNRDVVWTCDTSETYRLYECDLDYTNCNSIPIAYTTKDAHLFVLETNERTNEINLFDEHIIDEHGVREEKTLIFTYGENTRCYVDGCAILNE